jgi:hypothetical protein
VAKGDIECHDHKRGDPRKTNVEASTSWGVLLPAGLGYANREATYSPKQREHIQKTSKVEKQSDYKEGAIVALGSSRQDICQQKNVHQEDGKRHAGIHTLFNRIASSLGPVCIQNQVDDRNQNDKNKTSQEVQGCGVRLLRQDGKVREM